MSVKFKTLGGLLSFKYINDIEDLDLKDLQELYTDLEEKYNEIAEEFNEVKSELDKLKEVIDRKSQEEKSV